MSQISIPIQVIENKIFVIRGHKVMIDHDLAELYEVETKHLNRQVRRNKNRFPKEFMFQLNRQERDELVTICHRLVSLKHSSSLPYAFTEHGVLMLASVLNSDRAIKLSIFIVRTFIKLREFLTDYTEVESALKKLEHKVGKHDKEIQIIFEAIRKLMEPPEKPKPKIGF